jgi:acetyltransferase-like isoleucine patch superfamily enzyme
MERLGTRLRNVFSLLPGMRDLFITYLPGPGGNALRVRYYRKRCRFVGENVLIGLGVQIRNPEYVSIGDHCWIGHYVEMAAGPPHEGARKISRRENALFQHQEGDLVIGRNTHIASFVFIMAHGGVQIGDGCGVAPGARILSITNHYRNEADPSDDRVYSLGTRIPEADQALLVGAIVMGDNSGLAVNSVLMPGSAVGEYGGVGPLSLLTKSLEDGQLAQGVPARPISGIRGAQVKQRKDETAA